METKKRALGRGLEQLFSQEAIQVEELEKQIYESTPKEEIVEWMRKNMVFSRGQFEMSYRYGPESYMSKTDNTSEILQLSIRKVLENNPSLKGDSIPNFAWRIGHLLPMFGLGLPANKMHCCDEAVRLEDLTHLTEIYKDFLMQYFN